jgi:hypothetical protein
MEEEAEESAAEETAEHPEQPGAVDLELAVQDGDVEPGSGMVVNTDDVDLQGDGKDFGEDPAVGAKLPGDVDAVGEEVDSDEIGDEIDELQAKEEVDSDDGELSEDEEDDLEVVSEGTIQDKKPGAQNAPNKSGSMPAGGTTQDKGIAGASTNAKKLNSGKTGQDKKPAPQGGAPKSKGSMPGGGTTQDRNISKAKNTGNSKGSMPTGGTTQDKVIARSQGGAPNKSGSMPGGGTTQDKNLSK